MNSNVKTLAGSVAGLVVLAAVIFLTAWTLDYWQGWVFLAVFSISTLSLIVYWMEMIQRCWRSAPRPAPTMRKLEDNDSFRPLDQ